MKKLIAIAIAALTLPACSGLDRMIDEATYKHYPQYSEAKRAECREVGDKHYWANQVGGSTGWITAKARLEAAELFEKCMES